MSTLDPCCYVCNRSAVIKTYRTFKTDRLDKVYYYCANCYTKVISSVMNKGRTKQIGRYPSG